MYVCIYIYIYIHICIYICFAVSKYAIATQRSYSFYYCFQHLRASPTFDRERRTRDYAREIADFRAATTTIYRSLVRDRFQWRSIGRSLRLSFTFLFSLSPSRSRTLANTNFQVICSRSAIPFDSEGDVFNFLKNLTADAAVQSGFQIFF